MRRGVLLAFSLASLAVATAWHPVPGSPAARPSVSSDWRTMGNHERGVCIDGIDRLEHADPAAPYDVQRRTYSLGGRGCEALDNDQRSVCWVEPSRTSEGFEVIWYPHLDDVALGNLGFEVPCR